MGKTSKRTWGRSGLLTQWIIKYGYLPIVLIGMVGLALDIGTREWKSDDIIVADAFVMAEPPVVAETFVERRPPSGGNQGRAKAYYATDGSCYGRGFGRASAAYGGNQSRAKAYVQVAALNPDVRLPDESDQPASKGYIMYANLPTNWTPVPLPDWHQLRQHSAH